MKEDQHIEWKEAWRDEHLRAVCGFANADGGRLQCYRLTLAGEIYLAARETS